MNFHVRCSEFGANPARHSKSRFSDFGFLMFCKLDIFCTPNMGIFDSIFRPWWWTIGKKVPEHEKCKISWTFTCATQNLEQTPLHIRNPDFQILIFWYSGNPKILWFSIIENEKVLIFEPILQHDGGMQEIFFHGMKVAEFHELSRTLLEKLVRQC